jgi:hypothetical protein
MNCENQILSSADVTGGARGLSKRSAELTLILSPSSEVPTMSSNTSATEADVVLSEVGHHLLQVLLGLLVKHAAAELVVHHQPQGPCVVVERPRFDARGGRDCTFDRSGITCGRLGGWRSVESALLRCFSAVAEPLAVGAHLSRLGGGFRRRFRRRSCQHVEQLRKEKAAQSQIITAAAAG